MKEAPGTPYVYGRARGFFYCPGIHIFNHAAREGVSVSNMSDTCFPFPGAVLHKACIFSP